MLTRRELVLGIAVATTQICLYAAQDKQNRREEDLKTVTLTIEGMT